MSEPSAEDLVRRADLGDGVTRLTLNRPRKRNAMNRAARGALLDALDNCAETAKVIVLTGAGTAFCSGVDLKEAAAEGPDADQALPGLRTSWRAVQERIHDHPAIVIAAVNGYALGGGLTLINSSDLAIAAEDAQIGMPEVGFGVYPGLAGPSTQLRLGAKRAAWMVLTADLITGRTAAEWGLVNEAVPAERLDEAALALARRIAQFDAVTLTWSKRALHQVPAYITEWSAALRYGESVRAQIQVRSTAPDGGPTGSRRAEPASASAKDVR